MSSRNCKHGFTPSFFGCFNGACASAMPGAAATLAASSSAVRQLREAKNLSAIAKV